MNKLIYRIIRKLLLLSDKNKPRTVFFGPLKGKKWIYSSGYSEYFMGDYEKEVSDKFCELATKANVIYDIGSNIGFYTIAASNYIKNNGLIYSIEPFPSNIHILQKNVDANNSRKNIKILDFAISDVTGTASFSNSDNNVANTLNTDSPTYKGSSAITVKTTSIDELVFSNLTAPPDLIKIDVEGSELEALKGAVKTLEKFKPILILSTHNCHIPGIHRKCIDFLKNNNYNYSYLGFRENKTEFNDPWYEVLATHN